MWKVAYGAAQARRCSSKKCCHFTVAQRSQPLTLKLDVVHGCVLLAHSNF